MRRRPFCRTTVAALLAALLTLAPAASAEPDPFDDLPGATETAGDTDLAQQEAEDLGGDASATAIDLLGVTDEGDPSIRDDEGEPAGDGAGSIGAAVNDMCADALSASPSMDWIRNLVNVFTHWLGSLFSL